MKKPIQACIFDIQAVFSACVFLFQTTLARYDALVLAKIFVMTQNP